MTATFPMIFTVICTRLGIFWYISYCQSFFSLEFQIYFGNIIIIIIILVKDISTCHQVAYNKKEKL